MTGCGDSSALEVVENSRDYVITCNNVGGTGRQVKWERGAGLSAGQCPAVNNCQSVFAVLSRPSYSTSTMTVKSATRPAWGNRVVRCFTTLPPSTNVLSEDSCTLDVVCEYELLDNHASCYIVSNNNKSLLKFSKATTIKLLTLMKKNVSACICTAYIGRGGFVRQ